MILNNKKGSVTIFLTMFFTGLIILILVFVGAARERALGSATENIGNLCAHSVLAEYDRDLFNRYGLLGFYGDSGFTEDRIKFYSEHAALGKNYVKGRVQDVHLQDYNLSNENVFLNQIRKTGKFLEAGKMKSFVFRNKNDDDYIDPELRYREFSDGKDFGEINNQAIIGSLPSKGSDYSFSLVAWGKKFKDMNSFKDLAKKGSDEFFMNKYIDGYFRYFIDDKKIGDTFFKGEIEYIIFGGMSDYKNRRRTKAAIVGVREAVNYAWLNQNPEKKAAVEAVVHTISPGNIPLEQSILASWALAESENDYRLLIHGKPVPIKKTEETWAVDLQSVMENRAYNMIDTGNEEGYRYEDYIKVFLYLTDSRKKLLRIMDLIQINMKYLYNGDFLLQDYNEGLEFNLKVNGKNHLIESCY